MKAKNFPQLALLSLVCVACVQNPLAQAPAASSAPNTPTSTPIQTPSISPPVQTPIAQEPAASPAPNTPTPTPIQTQSPNPTPVPTQTSLEVAQKPTNSLPPAQTYDLRVIDRLLWRRLTKITFGEDSIIVTMVITNGSKEVVILNGENSMYSGSQKSEVCPMPYALCPMPYALCPRVPHLSEKGYISTTTMGNDIICYLPPIIPKL